MTRVVMVRKGTIWMSMAVMLLAGSMVFYWLKEPTTPVGGLPEGDRVIHMVTGEYKSTTPEGQVIESYRWDPGTVFVEKGEKVKLVIYGVNGETHPFYIEGTNIKGEVRKGKETIVTFQPEKEGTYRLICLTHPEKDHSGPMIGYIVVD